MRGFIYIYIEAGLRETMFYVLILILLYRGILCVCRLCAPSHSDPRSRGCTQLVCRPRSYVVSSLQ
jgi:hypothetical protein